MTELKTPDAKELKFVANGKNYVIETKLSIARRIVYDKLVAEISTGLDLKEQFTQWKEVYQLCQDKSPHYADIAVRAHNQMTAVKNWEERRDPIAMLCALFINEETEDRRYITDESIKAKIADWEAEGIDHGFFSHVASVFMKSTTESWSNYFPTSSNEPS